MLADFPHWKRVVFYGVCALAVIGVFNALSNLPVVSNCAFYAECDAHMVEDIDAI